jgi:uncharacterized membrane protein YdjX (TVP38/TMEM64 family)
MVKFAVILLLACVSRSGNDLFRLKINLMKKNVILIVLLLGIALIYVYNPGQHLTLENLKLNQDRLEDFYQANSMAMIGGYITLYMLIGLLLLPGSTFLSFASGFIFGPGLGVAVVNIGATLGATLAFLVSRYLLRDWIEKKFAAKVKTVNDHLCQNAINCILFFRLVPLFPFFSVNIGLSLSKVPLRLFFFGTMFGTLPATFVYVNAGSNLASINSFSEIMSVQVLGSLMLLGLLAMIPVIYKQVKSRNKA